MAIYTPRGLKVRITIPIAFGLMSRLSPYVTPFRVLKTTEGMECISSLITFIACLVAFGFRLPPFQITLAVGAAHLIGRLMSIFALHPSPGLVILSTYFSFLSGYGFYLAIITIIGFKLVGWQGLLGYFAGRVIASALSWCIEFWRSIQFNKCLGFPVFSPEISFFNAYIFHARRIGKPTDIELSELELEESFWRPTFDRFASDWPEIVGRFSD